MPADPTVSVRCVRAAVDVVVPFYGSPPALADLVERVGRLSLAAGDTVTVVDNSGAAIARDHPESRIRLVRAPERQSSYYARNRGAAGGVSPWLVFIDADVDPVSDLLDRYFAAEPAADTGILVGAVRDVAAVARRESLASRYARLRGLIDQSNTLQTVRPYAKTANCAIRREAFEQVGGFVDDIRSGGDADLCFRLQEADWGFETRPDALVEHRARRRLVGLLRQRARHGSGAEWLEERYPGFAGPRRRARRVLLDIARGVAHSVIALARGNENDALTRAMDPISNAAFELGRRLPNGARPMYREFAAARLRPRRRHVDQSKSDAEFFYWQGRHQVEGRLSNAHYERVYTTSFGLQRTDFAGKRVLDIGCGPRGSLEWATDAAERVGVDPLVGRYRELGIERHAMTYVESGAEHIPFPDNHFDVVAALNALDHVDDVDAVIREMTRVARPGGLGLLLVEVNHAPTATEPHSLGWDLLRRFGEWEVVDERHVKLDETHDVHGSWLRGAPWREGPGLLGATLRRKPRGSDAAMTNGLDGTVGLDAPEPRSDFSPR
jgi:SAM-dependent methyltransferase/GT2 family glycosyltransferase